MYMKKSRLNIKLREFQMLDDIHTHRYHLFKKNVGNRPDRTAGRTNFALNKFFQHIDIVNSNHTNHLRQRCIFSPDIDYFVLIIFGRKLLFHGMVYKFTI